MNYSYEKKETILKFYKIMRFTKFKKITPKRQLELDTIVRKWDYFFKSQAQGIFPLMTMVAERLITSSNKFGLTNGNEMAYFYVKLIDPTLKMLEIYECSNTKEEIKKYCMINFRFYDTFFIFLERCYNERFQEYKSDELWSRDSIKR